MEQMEEKIGGCISYEQTCAADLKVREYYNYLPKKSREKINLSGKTWKQITHPLPKRQWSVLDPKWKEQGQLPRLPKPESCSSNYVTVSSSRDIERCVGHDFQKQIVMHFLFTKHFSVFVLKWALLERFNKKFLEQRFLINLVDLKHRYAKVKKEINKIIFKRYNTVLN